MDRVALERELVLIFDVPVATADEGGAAGDGSSPVILDMTIGEDKIWEYKPQSVAEK